MEGSTQAGAFAGDYDTPEQRVGVFQNERPWESCITICQQWAWKPQDQLKSLAECVRTLVSCAGGDGNLLLNVGPMPDGRIEPRQVARLREIGAWLRQYGETLYATRGGPFKPGKWGASTRRGSVIYVHIFDWGQADALHLPAIEHRVLKATALTGGLAEVRQTQSNLEIRVAKGHRREIDTIVALRLDASAADLEPRQVAP
jgi:alpha-L-fucosidase